MRYSSEITFHDDRGARGVHGVPWWCRHGRRSPWGPCGRPGGTPGGRPCGTRALEPCARGAGGPCGTASQRAPGRRGRSCGRRVLALLDVGCVHHHVVLLVALLVIHIVALLVMD